MRTVMGSPGRVFPAARTFLAMVDLESFARSALRSHSNVSGKGLVYSMGTIFHFEFDVPSSSHRTMEAFCSLEPPRTDRRRLAWRLSNLKSPIAVGIGFHC